ncbi:UNVERIFIED_CONTAM: hypothetical protein K2H54_058227 [Gekko kuhli]
MQSCCLNTKHVSTKFSSEKIKTSIFWHLEQKRTYKGSVGLHEQEFYCKRKSPTAQDQPKSLNANSPQSRCDPIEPKTCPSNTTLPAFQSICSTVIHLGHGQANVNHKDIPLVQAGNLNTFDIFSTKINK